MDNAVIARLRSLTRRGVVIYSLSVEGMEMYPKVLKDEGHFVYRRPNEGDHGHHAHHALPGRPRVVLLGR